MEQKKVLFSYGCASHALHNLSMDIGKLRDFATAVKNEVYVSNTVRNTGLLRKLYDNFCIEKEGRFISMKLFSPSCWTSVNEMFNRFLRVLPVMNLMSHVLLNEREQRNIDETFELTATFDDILKKPSFWKDFLVAVNSFYSMCACIGYLENDSCTFSDAYAAFIFVRAHVNQFDDLITYEKTSIYNSLLRRWNHIYNPVHSLAFCCDPFYD